MTASAFAADPGFYAGADVGRSITGTIAPGAVMTQSKSVVGGVFLGYHFTQNWGVEGIYTGGGKFATTGPRGAVSSGKADVFGIGVVGTLPLSDAFSLYGKLGYARTVTTESSAPAGLSGTNRSGATYGLGAQYNVTPQVGIRLGWDRYGAAVSEAGATSNFNTNVWSLGALYNF